jgi:Sensors of blue-light using FAD
VVNASNSQPSDGAQSTLPSTLSDTLPAAGDTKLDKPSLSQMLVCSIVTGQPKPEHLQALSEVSAQNNRNRGLSGVLLCGNGVFVHWLEGLDDYLQEAWTSIAKDQRHENVVVLWRRHDAPERLFGDWVMGLRNTIVAHDLLAMLNTIKAQNTAKTMLTHGYYEVFTDAFALLQRVCASHPGQAAGAETLVERKLLGPAREVALAMRNNPFKPEIIEPPARAAPAQASELSTLGTDASSIFKNSVPAEHAMLFDMAAEGVDDLLTMLDMPLRWALGADLWARRKTLSDKPLHWTYEDKLVAVFDHKSWKLGMHPELTHVAYETTAMAERLRSANDIPSQFRQTTAYALFWDYAMSDQSKDIKLPSRFMQGRIRLRRPPPVPEPTLTAHQSRVVAILTKSPERLGDLAQTLGLTLERMAHELRPFYAARSVEAAVQ